jgi:amidophosphoribosyltransferase
VIYTHVILSNDAITHSCGVAGIFSPYPAAIPEMLFYALFAQQHRGQESAGIAYRRDGKTVAYKDLGMVSSVLHKYLNKPRESRAGIGHVRYSTYGASNLENVQPIVADCNKGEIALAHNGNISNTATLKERLFSDGSIFQSTSDTELMLHLISRSRQSNFYDSLTETLLQLQGAYSLSMLHNDSLLAVRDPLGFRPLYWGEKNGIIVFASETCGLDILKIDNYRPVKPGEMVVCQKGGTYTKQFAHAEKKHHCIFELIYFARPDSSVFEESVHQTREKMGAAIADGDTSIGDIVVPIPDSGNIAALGYAKRSGLPFEMALTRNHYAGRSFILPTTAQRELAVRMKLHPVRSAINGKRVVVIDDSLVRGTTSSILVKMLREAGAKEIHLRLSSPELKFPCYYGIDIPTREELISNHKTPEEIARLIGADSVRFLPIEKLATCVSHPQNYCYACFNGHYPQWEQV